MDFDLSSPYFIYLIILLCLCIILFYLYYKMYVKLNTFSEKINKVDKFISDVISSAGERFQNTIPTSKSKSNDEMKMQMQMQMPMPTPIQSPKDTNEIIEQSNKNEDLDENENKNENENKDLNENNIQEDLNELNQ